VDKRDDSNQSNNTYGAKFYDLSSYGNNGTASGNAEQVIAGSLGKDGFDGSTDCIKVSSEISDQMGAFL